MTRRLDQPAVEELLGAYALDAVEPWERRQIESLLAADPRLRAEVQSHREVAAVLAEATLSLEEAPPAVWTHISAELEDAPPPLELAPVRRPPPRRRLLWRGTTVTIAAAAAAVVVVAIGVRIARPERSDSLAGAAAVAVTAPGSEVMTLSAPVGAPPADARIVVGADGSGFMFSDDLPALAESRTYQLWVLMPDAVISAGILGSDPGVTAFQVDPEYAGFAITEEVAGGVAASENAPVALWVRS